jgi:hypothetical protein
MDIPYVLVGSIKGRTMRVLGDIHFVDGRALIPESAHLSCGHLLRMDYSAVPESEVTPEVVAKVTPEVVAEVVKHDVPAEEPRFIVPAELAVVKTMPERAKRR